MDALPATSSSLDLTISIAGSSSGGVEGGSGEIGMIDLDINQVPKAEGEDRSWPMMTIDTYSSMDLDDQDDDHISNGREGTTGPRKKLRLSKDQSRLLEDSFRLNHTLNTKQKEELATRLQLKPRQVEVWFQNRRARSKLKQTEMEVEYLKRWFSTLTEQNRWLQKEVEELRSMKVGPPTVLSPHTREPLPASTLTMCPRCERVSTTNPTASKQQPLGTDRAVSPATKSQTDDMARQPTSTP